jgi:hypothetical protein
VPTRCFASVQTILFTFSSLLSMGTLQKMYNREVQQCSA